MAEAERIEPEPVEPIEPVEPGQTEEGKSDAQPKPGEPAYTKAVQARINQLTREKHEERRRADALAAENAALKTRAAAGPRPTPPDPRTFATETGEIDPTKYQRVMAEYEDRLHGWRQTQVAPAASPAQGVADPDTALAAAAATFIERAEPLREEHADFDATVNAPVFTPVLRDALFESEQGPAISYHLGKQPAEALRIGALPREQMYRELGRLEARFANTDRRTTSGAPEPITPVQGTAGGPTNPEKMSIDEYMRWESQRRLERLKTHPFGGA